MADLRTSWCWSRINWKEKKSGHISKVQNTNKQAIGGNLESLYNMYSAYSTYMQSPAVHYLSQRKSIAFNVVVFSSRSTSISLFLHLLNYIFKLPTVANELFNQKACIVIWKLLKARHEVNNFIGVDDERVTANCSVVCVCILSCLAKQQWTSTSAEAYHIHAHLSLLVGIGITNINSNINGQITIYLNADKICILYVLQPQYDLEFLNRSGLFDSRKIKTSNDLNRNGGRIGRRQFV